MKNVYDAATSKGIHLHEEDVNWRETLPSPIPYRWNPSATPHGEEKAALYQEAVDKRIIDIKSKSDPNVYMVRILADTTDLVAEYTRDRYYFNGVFQAADLKRDIAALQAKREELFLPELDEKTGYKLLNDGYVNTAAGADQDFRERVRKDYFIRFGGLQAIAKESLKQLNRVDDKLAEMNFWMNEVGLANAKSKRFLRLFVTGQLEDDGYGTIQLIYSYQGSNHKTVLCNPNMEYAASHPLYRAYVNLNAMESDREGKQILGYLDTKLDETFQKLAVNQTGDWVKRNRKLAEDYTYAKVDVINESTAMLPEHDELVDFYKRLGEQAAELSKLLKSEPVEPEIPQDTTITPSVTTTATVDTWTCPECGKVCKMNWKCCPVCDTERPANVGGQPAIPEFWDCPECGKKGLKIKFKMCPVCDTPNPFADLLKKAAPVAPTSWDCPECGKKGLKLKFKMCPVCDTPRPAELDQFVD
jgi:rubrerythrin